MLAEAYAKDAARTASSVDDALRRVGVPEARIIACSSASSAMPAAVASAGDCLAQVAPGECNRFGLAVHEAENRTIAVGVCVQSAVDLDPMASFFEREEKLSLRATLRPPYTSASVVLTSPTGRTIRPEVSMDGRKSTSLLSLDEKGVWQVELLGTGPRGPESLLNFPVRVAIDLEPFTVLAASELESTQSQELEERLLELLNGTRRGAGLPLLEAQSSLARVARRYSQEMAQTGIVAHVSELSGSVSDRVAREGLHPAGLAENLAMASSAAEAHVGLMASPGHRANILSPLARRVGIGVAVIQGRPAKLYVTQVFELVPDETKLDVSAPQLVDTIQQLRKARGLPALRRDSKLERAAKDAVASCPDFAPFDASNLKGRFAKLSQLALMSSEPQSALAGAKELLKSKRASIGLATRRTKKDGAMALCIVILLGTNE